MHSGSQSHPVIEMKLAEWTQDKKVPAPMLRCSLHREMFLCVLIFCILPTVGSIASLFLQDFSTKEALKATTSFLTADQIRRLTLQVNASRQRLAIDKAPSTLLRAESAPQETDIIFRAMSGINSTRDVFVAKKTHGRYINTIQSLYVKSHINEAFVSKVPRNARLTLELLCIFNNSVVPGDTLSWIGGFASVDDLKLSRVFILSQECRAILLYGEDGIPRRVQAVAFMRSGDPFRSVLLGMNLENSPGLCGGSGLVSNEHSNLSQRGWASSISSDKRTESLGIVQSHQLNDGNYVIGPTDKDRDGLERLEDSSLGVWLSSNLNGGIAISKRNLCAVLISTITWHF